MKNEIQSKDPEFESQGFVSLPLNEGDFKEFIVGLLGKPQSIENIIEGAFEVDNGIIKDIYLLINQRITQQNDSILISFIGRIVYEDNSSITLNSIESLLAHNEIRPIISTELHLTFQYLINFQPKKVPEKQEINISFIASSTSDNDVTLKTMDLISPTSILKRYLRRKSYEQGFVQYNIKHTARTWGVDIDSLLRNYFQNLMIQEGVVKNFFREWRSLFSFGTMILIISSGLYFGIKAFKAASEKKEKAIDALFSKELDLKQISEQIKYIATEGAKDETILPFFIFMTTMILASIGGLLTLDSLKKKRDSFVLLTKKSNEFKIESNKEYSKQLRNFLLTLLISIGSSVFANYLFVYLSTK